MKQTPSVLATALAASVSAGPAQASASDGVSCPTGADASVSNGELKCSVTLEFVRLSMCPRVDYPNCTQIELRGVDQYQPQVAPLQGKTAVDSATTPMSLNPLSPWQIDQRNGRDLRLSKGIAGNRVTGQYTIPDSANCVGAMGNPAQHGWTLAIDRSGEVDHWVKNGTLHKYPVAR